jgi:hypothetical protein
MAFAADLAKLCARAGDRADHVVRSTALGLQSGMVERTPVDTGRAKNNWQCGVGAVDFSANEAPDRAGGGAISRTAAALEAWRPGRSIHLTNSMPYAQALEDGSSRQAPYGMVKLTVQAYGDAFARAVAELK